MSSDDPEQPASFSSLRARFEQLSAAASPTATPKPATAPSTRETPAQSVEAQDSAQKASRSQEPPLATELSGCDVAHRGSTTGRGSAQAVEDLTSAGRAGESMTPPIRFPKPPAVGRHSSTASTLVCSPAPPPPTVAPPSQKSQSVSASSSPPFDDRFSSTSDPRDATSAPSVPIRPRNGAVTGSLRRPAPPPPAARAASTELADLRAGYVSNGSDTQHGRGSTVQEAASPALSVKGIASKFNNDPSTLSRPASTTSLPLDDPFERSVMTHDEPSETDQPVSDDGARDSDSGKTNGTSYDTEGEGSVYSSSPEQTRTLSSRPAIPPRPPVIVELPPTPSGLPAGVAPPPLPSRSSTASSSQSGPLAPVFGSPPTLPDGRSRSPSEPASIAQSASAPLLPPPLPRRDPALGSTPSPVAGKAPPLPARNATVPVVALPPRPSPQAASSAAVAGAAYVPPPPPTRSVAAGDRLAPQRPSIIPGGDGSSEDEDDALYAALQELPDATFANRRPPTLRNRKPINASHQFSVWAARGSRVVTAHHRLHIWRTSATGATCESLPIANDQQKFLALEFRPADIDRPEDDGRYVWCGTKEGTVYEVDIEHHVITAVRGNVHASPVCWIFRSGRGMLTLDEGGKCIFWGSRTGEEAPQLSGNECTQQRVPDKQAFAALVGDHLWTSSGPTTKPGSTAVATRSPQVRVYDPVGSRAGGAFSLLARPLVTPESAGNIGAVTGSAVVPALDHFVYLSHDNGFVSVWDRATFNCMHVQRVSPYAVSALVGLRRFLWAGFRTGHIYVYDVSVEPWVVVKAWKAHKDPVIRLSVDSASLWKDETLQVVSATNDTICMWDGLLREDWIDAELHLRQPDFCTFRSAHALCISWNIDASRPGDLHGTVDNLEFLHNALTSAESPDIISIGFQEVIDLEDKKLTAKSMLMGKKKATDGKMSDSISSAYRLWHDKLVQAVRLNMPPETPYTVVHVADMIGLFSMVFVKTSEVVHLRDVAHITVKTGMGGRYGNKGAILSRFVIDDTSLCFINCHLAAGQFHRRQRDRDLVDILEDKASFSELASSSPGAYTPGGSGTLPFDHELIILSGDLNYRIDARRDAVVSAVASGNSESLLAQDQLLKNLATNQTFRLRSFKEPTIHFPPTYKYDPGTDQYDSSPKRRIPAWCDRVLYRADRGDKIKPLHYKRYEVNVSDHRPISAAFDLQIKQIHSDKRAAVWTEVERAWFSVESGIIEEALKWYNDR